MNIIDGNAVALNVKNQVKLECEALKKKGITPGLAVIIVGDDPASQADVPRGRGRRNFEGDFELTDRLSKQAQVLREQYRLSARETEVMEYIARGYTVARTAEELIVSENTIRTHSKCIYAKLDVHKKQELIDMLKAVEL